MRALAAESIQTRPLWQPIHLSPAHRDGVVLGGCQMAERLSRNALSLPCSVGLQEEDQTRVVSSVLQQHRIADR